MNALSGFRELPEVHRDVLGFYKVTLEIYLDALQGYRDIRRL